MKKEEELMMKQNKKKMKKRNQKEEVLKRYFSYLFLHFITFTILDEQKKDIKQYIKIK